MMAINLERIHLSSEKKSRIPRLYVSIGYFVGLYVGCIILMCFCLLRTEYGVRSRLLQVGLKDLCMECINMRSDINSIMCVCCVLPYAATVPT